MAIKLADAVVYISEDHGGLGRGLKRAEGEVRGWGHTISTAIGTFLGNVMTSVANLALRGVQLIGRAGSQAIGLASDATEMMGKFNVVFGDFAGDVERQLADFGKAVGRSKYELMGMAASVQDTFVPLGFARDQAADMSVTLSKLAVDVASFNNASDADVMRDFQSALVGNTETVRKYGIVITQATLDAELLRMGISGGVNAASEQEKVLARLNLIMAGTSDAQGDAARTADSWANSSRALKAKVTDFITGAGLKLLDTLTPLLNIAGDLADRALPALERMFGKLEEPVARISGAIQEFLERVGLVRQEAETPAQHKLLSGMDLGAPVPEAEVQSVREALLAMLPPEVTEKLSVLLGFFDRLGAWFAEHGPAIRATAEQTFGKLQENLGRLGEQVGPFVTEQLDKIASWVEENGPLIEDFAAAVGDGVAFLNEKLVALWPTVSLILGGVIDLVLGIAQTIMQVATGDWSGAWETIKGTAATAWEAIKGAFGEFVNWVLSWLGTNWGEVAATWQSNWDNFKLIVETVWDNIKTAVGEKLTGIVEGIRGRVADFESIGNDLIQGLLNGIKAKFDGASSFIQAQLMRLPGWARQILGIGSPSKVFMEIGTHIPEGLALGVEQGFSEVRSAMSGLMGQTIAPTAQLMTASVGMGSGASITIENLNLGLERLPRTEREAEEGVRRFFDAVARRGGQA